MKIKKYEATTEQEAIEKVKQELGLEALILNIKKTQPRGIFSFLRKPTVEVTAAYEEKTSKEKMADEKDKNTQKESSKPQKFDEEYFEALAQKTSKKSDRAGKTNDSDSDFFENLQRDRTLLDQQEKIDNLEKKLKVKEELLEKVVPQLSLSKHNFYTGNRKYENNMIQLFYDSLTEQGVTQEIAEKLLEDVNSIKESDKIDINLIVKIVYNTIINVFGEPQLITTEEVDTETPKIIDFMGPTGVGKTTTIAKLSSLFVLNDNYKVGLITADTYRIAAVEQLKTYAEILGLEVGVVYNGVDLKNSIDEMKNVKELILIDTAGRSHKNSENFKELAELLKETPGSERYLVLSITTKYEDLTRIIEAYSKVTDFSIIFTKLDETTCYGSMLNICFLTGKKISYITNGQNVPDDIEVLRPEKIAKALLGFGGDIF